jgi:hypothetical protein
MFAIDYHMLPGAKEVSGDVMVRREKAKPNMFVT